MGSIDAAAHVFQRRARDVLLGGAILLVPMVALNLLLSVLAFRNFQSYSGLFATRGYIGAESGATFAAVLLQSLSAHVIGAYVAAYLARYQLGGEPTIRIALSATLRRLPVLILTWVLSHWWAFLLLLLVIDDPATASVAGGFLGPLLGIPTAMVLLTVPVVMIEGPRRAVRRSIRLAGTRFGAAWGFVLTCALMASLLFLFIGLLPQLAESTGLITFGRFAWLFGGIALQIALLVIIPLVGLATAQFYLQMRVYSEGIDITLAADRAFGPAS
jgi:hypothetical protein